jgi:hypothetical protein
LKKLAQLIDILFQSNELAMKKRIEPFCCTKNSEYENVAPMPASLEIRKELFSSTSLSIQKRGSSLKRTKTQARSK